MCLICVLWVLFTWLMVHSNPKSNLLAKNYIFKGKPELLNHTLQLKPKGTLMKVISYCFWYYIVLQAFA